MNRLILLLTLFTVPLFGVGVSSLSTPLKTLTEQNLANNPVTSSYSGTYAQFASSLSGKSNFCITNGGTQVLLGSTNSTSCGVSTAATFIVPATNGTTCLERVSINSVVCLKTPSISSTSGTVYGMFW